MSSPIVTIHLTRVDAEAWHFDRVELHAKDWADWDWTNWNPDALDVIERHVREAFYELGYVFDDDAGKQSLEIPA